MQIDNLPKPIKQLSADVLVVDTDRVPPETPEWLVAGKVILLQGQWGSMCSLQAEIRKGILATLRPKSFLAQQDADQLIRHYLRMMLVEVCDKGVGLKKAPQIGWLKNYGIQERFYLTVPDVLGLNSSWQWYQQGIHLPELKGRLHPLHGVYFPTRHEHVELFARWTKGMRNDETGFSQSTSPRLLASSSLRCSDPLRIADVGTGCGVLSFIMLEWMSSQVVVWATDCNKNALYSVEGDARQRGVEGRIHLLHTDLLKGCPQELDLIVCNPPWLPGSRRGALEEATCYSSKFFDELFLEAHAHLCDGGQFVLLFSNFAELAGLTNKHPIREEIRRHDRFDFLEKRTAPVAQPRSAAPDWLKRLRRKERVELWVLKCRK